MRPFRAIVFDLFDTLIRFDYSRLPRVELGGKLRPSTLGEVVDILRAAGESVELDRLARVTMRISAEQEAEKQSTGREFPAAHRWTAVLAELEIDPQPALVEAIVQRHMDLLCGATVLDPADAAALGRLGERFPLGLLSNFDHAPSVRSLLDRLELTPAFQHVAISDELGWRKPELRVFTGVADALGVPVDACLFVGDNVEMDVMGAHAAGMQAAWLTKPDSTFPPDAQPPALRAVSVAELEQQLAAHAAD